MSIRNNCERDAVLVGVINSATSLYASIPIFSILGFKATSALNSCLHEYVSTAMLCQFKVSSLLSNITEECFLYYICRNIMLLTNHFEFSDQNITLENYDHWFDYLNKTKHYEVTSLPLRHCDLKTFLDQVMYLRKHPNLHSFHELHFSSI